MSLWETVQKVDGTEGQRDVSAHLLGPWLGPQLQLVPGLVALPGLAQV